MKRYIILFITVIFCIPVFAVEFLTGDLIFVVENKGEFSNAISEATSSDDNISFIHVGILFTENDSICILDASPKKGVGVTSFSDFTNEFQDYVIKRPDFVYPVKDMMDRAMSHLGEEYDWWYLPNNGKTYCSELVYDSYLDSDGKHIFKANPMNFKSKDGSYHQFWVDLFSQIGEEIPQGVPGTNPNDLSKDPRLVTIFTSKN